MIDVTKYVGTMKIKTLYLAKYFRNKNREKNMVYKQYYSELRVAFQIKSLATTMSYACNCCDSSEALEQEEKESIFFPNRILPSSI